MRSPVHPFNLKLKSDLGFYLVTPLEMANSKKVVAFRTWLIDLVQSAESASASEILE